MSKRTYEQLEAELRDIYEVITQECTVHHVHKITSSVLWRRFKRENPNGTNDEWEAYRGSFYCPECKSFKKGVRHMLGKGNEAHRCNHKWHEDR